MPSPAKLEIDDLSMRFDTPAGGFLALDHVSLAVRRGAFISLVGPSGCGKSTIFNIVAGLQEPTSGRVLIDGVDSTGIIGRVGYMLQKDLLLPWRTVLENVMFGVEIQRLALPERRRRAHALLENFNLAEFAGHYPHQLSGGMRQRVAIARALLGGPRILLMDEPFGAVDEITRDRLNEELLRIWRETGTTIVFVTHSIYEAAFLGTEVLVLAANPGRVREIMPIRLDEPRRLRARETPEFMRQAAHLRAVLETC